MDEIWPACDRDVAVQIQNLGQRLSSRDKQVGFKAMWTECGQNVPKIRLWCRPYLISVSQIHVLPNRRLKVSNLGHILDIFRPFMNLIGTSWDVIREGDLPENILTQCSLASRPTLRYVGTMVRQKSKIDKNGVQTIAARYFFIRNWLAKTQNTAKY